MNTKNLIRLTLIIFFLILATIIYYASDTYIEPKITDSFVSNLVQKEGSKDIVLVVIDGKSLDKIRWPWSRDLYAEVFDFLEHKADAKVVLFDAVMNSPGDGDDKLYNYLKTSNKIVFGFDVCRIGVSCESLQKNMNAELNKKIHLKIEDRKKYHPKKIEYTTILNMPVELVKNSKNFGSVVSVENSELGVRMIRTYSNLIYLNGTYYPSVALVAYSMIKGENEFIVTDKNLYSKNHNLNINLPSSVKDEQQLYSTLKWYKPYCDSSISENNCNNDKKNVWDNVKAFFGINEKPTEQYYTHKYYSAIDILESNKNIKEGKKPIINPEEFKDKIVFVGGYAKTQSLDDRFASPILAHHAGVDIQATALNNYLDNSFSTKADFKFNLLITVLILLVSFLVIYFAPPIVSLTINSALLCLYFAIYQLCLRNDFIINFITVFLLEILLFAFAYIYQFIIEGEKKDKIQNAMGKYLSIDVMQKVVKDIDNISLGGKKTDATIMFIDIRKFTTISEKMGADDVSLLLNSYFTTVYPIITKYDGILNKFIGDAVLAIFTSTEKNNNHAKNAIYCADEILKQVKKLQQKWINEGKPKIDIGVGINSGEVFIGNIGTQERMEYTVIGDTVNTASRIEGYNKIYKTKFLIGENTYELVKNKIDVIKINQVTIRGKMQKINIYEVLRIRK